MGVTLRDKFYGCICGAHIGSAMGAIVECWSYAQIEEKYGTLDNFYSCVHYNNGWVREPGTTEDGIERQKLMITAIIEKGDRVNAEDVRKIWCRDIKENAAGQISEPFEGVLLAMAKSNIPARDLGRYCDYAGLVSFGRACHPIGLINAGDIQGAIDDVFEVGQLYQSSNSRGLKWATVTAVAIAEATKPNATVDSVIDAILQNLSPKAIVPGRDDWCADYAGDDIKQEVVAALKLTENCKDFREMRVVFDDVYSGIGIPYSLSYANEIITKAICIFRMVKGNLKDAIIAASNMGRDTDCVAAVAAGIAGALDGTASLPPEWIKQVDYATSVNRYTNSQRTLKETSDGLYDAYKNRLHTIKTFTELMDIE